MVRSTSMMRYICCCGPGSSSMKPERVLGVILDMVESSFVDKMRAESPCWSLVGAQSAGNDGES